MIFPFLHFEYFQFVQGQNYMVIGDSKKCEIDKIRDLYLYYVATYKSFPLTYLEQTNALNQIKKMETYQKATKTSAKVSKSENAANTIQYIIHFT